MSDYQLGPIDDVVIRTRDNTAIPRDPPGNADWQQYEQWLADGGAPDPYVEPSPLPPRPEDVVLFDHENRIRSLEGQEPLTPDEFEKMARP